jgi:L-amino acid N-acyltransferase YncA
MDIEIRAAQQSDLPRITQIYGQSVSTSTASFELLAPNLNEMTRRWRGLISEGYPYLVAQESDTAKGGDVMGYAYAGSYRTRPAYQFVVENSVYVAEAHRGKGVGKALLKRLIIACEGKLYRQMVAIIGDTRNPASAALHKAMGFREVGVLRNIGHKHDAWHDTLIMQRSLSTGPQESAD